jgi:hypothetical protein
MDERILTHLSKDLKEKQKLEYSEKIKLTHLQ